MDIRGLQKVTLLDYPGKIACTVFVPGCNFRCPFCHNRDLVLRSPSLVSIPETDFFEFLERRRGKLEGVVVTGGEPLLQKDLGDFLQRVKGLGFATKLDTNGSFATVLHSIVARGVVDYIAFDIKAPFDERYSRAIGLAGDEMGASDRFDPRVILKSVGVAAELGVPFELRTTVVPVLHSEGDLLDLAKQLKNIVPKAKWILQNFRPKSCLDPEFEKIEPYGSGFFEDLLKKLRAYMPLVQVR